MDGRKPEPPQIVVAGHICLDIIPALSEALDLRPGGLVVVGASTVSTGGPVGNVGLALHRLGVPVRLMGRIGDDTFGRAVLEVLRARDSRLADGMIVAPAETTSYSIVINPPGVDRTFLHCPGANATFGAGDLPLQALKGARILHFGYPPLMPRLYSDGGAESRGLFESIRARGLAVSLDMCEPNPHGEASRVDWAQWLARVLPEGDVFAPSLDELRVMLREARHAPLDLASLRALASRVMDVGPALVALKLGDQGLYLRTGGGKALDRLCRVLGLDAETWRGREVLSPCFSPVRLAGTTGSGDATIAGMLAALLRREGPVSVATCATAVGACSVEAPDATSGIPQWCEVAARLAAGWPRLPLAPGLTDAAAWQRDSLGTLFDPDRPTRPFAKGRL